MVEVMNEMSSDEEIGGVSSTRVDVLRTYL